MVLTNTELLPKCCFSGIVGAVDCATAMARFVFKLLKSQRKRAIEDMSTETGRISIDAENILPIIKKWLYSEKEIFLRELVANAADAMHKLHKMSTLGETTRELVEFAITISCDPQAKTLTITDTGVGMTAAEIKKYINQVAFSGLQDFVAKYQDKEANQQVIGHFGLGFYSSFMVAERV